MHVNQPTKTMTNIRAKRKFVFYLYSLTGGGAERQCSYMANYLSKNENEVFLITVEKPKELQEYYLAEDVKRVSLQCNGPSAGVFGALCNNIKIVSSLQNTIRKLKPDVVISFMAAENITCALSCIGINTVHLAAERNYPPFSIRKKMWQFLRKFAYSLPDVIVCQTVQGSTWIMENTWAKKVATIPNPIILPLPKSYSEHSSISNSTELGVAHGKFILAVGRLVPQKQYDLLIRVFSKVCHNFPEWNLVIVGDGPEKEMIERQIFEYELQDRIVLTGRQPDVESWYERAKIFALTSAHEGYPNTLAEAMSYGVAVLSLDCPTGPSSLISHEVNGLLISPENEAELQQQLGRLMSDSSLRKKLGKNAKSIVHKHRIESIMGQWDRLISASTLVP